MSEDISDTGIEALLAEFARAELCELHVRHGAFELYLSNDAAARPIIARGNSPALPPSRSVGKPGTAAVKPAPTPAASIPADAIIVCAPNLGTFYRAPKPGAAAYVEIGASVAAGDELCLIEVMKLFTAVRADSGGRILAVLAEDGSMVEAGQPLFALARD